MDVYQFKDLADIAGNIATVIVMLVGGIWAYMLFVRRRQKYPRANIIHRANHRYIEDCKVLLNVDVTISNTGDVLLSLVSGEIRIQRVLPLSSEMLDLIKTGRGLVGEGKMEVEWPLIDSRRMNWEKGKFEIEPGESDQLRFDFVLDAKNQSIVIYTFFENAKKRKREIGWHFTTVYDPVGGDDEGTKSKVNNT